MTTLRPPTQRSAVTAAPATKALLEGPGRVGVIGGGIAGLATAHYLQAAGAQVDLFEAAPSFGGLGSSFSHEGHDLDRFYHVILPTDKHLLDLCAVLGVQDQLYWEEASLGFFYRRQLYGLSGPLDLLRFAAVPLIDRLRLGLTALYCGYVASAAGLDDLTAADCSRDSPDGSPASACGVRCSRRSSVTLTTAFRHSGTGQASIERRGP